MSELIIVSEAKAPVWQVAEDHFVTHTGEKVITSSEKIGGGQKKNSPKQCFKATLMGEEVALLISSNVAEGLDEIERTQRAQGKYVGIPPLLYGTFPIGEKEHLAQVQPLCTRPEDRLKGEDYPLMERVGHLIHLFKGLGELKERKLTHCDLRLDNTLITPKGRLRIIDLEFLSEEQRLVNTTKTRGWKGDAAIVPPEIQVWNERSLEKDINRMVHHLREPQSPQTDLFAAGLMAEKLIEGYTPTSSKEHFMLESLHAFVQDVKGHWRTKSPEEGVKDLKAIRDGTYKPSEESSSKEEIGASGSQSRISNILSTESGVTQYTDELPDEVSEEEYEKNPYIVYE
ncbi:MAG: hypothetical protein AB7F31_06125 [Parachlamydiales bacterium]